MNECKQHCPCHLEALRKRSEGGKKGAAITNSKYSTEKRREAGKKGYENRLKRIAGVDFSESLDKLNNL